jgi:NADPH-dependent 2,4-dienoyl-CoA reductase/sulfur reductase-like enzyme
MPKGLNIPYGEAIKKAVKIPVIIAGRIDYSIADEVLREGKADFVALGRPLLADPHLPNKLQDGRLEEITECIYCNNCMEHEPRRSCTVNPSVGREREYELKPAISAKRVIVVGGGLAGMKAAGVLAERGHKVSLYEKSGILGGQFAVAAQQPDKEHFNRFIQQLSDAMVKAGVDIKLKQEVSAKVIKELQPDAVILATGAKPATLDVPGVDGKNVVQAVDVITRKAKVGNTVAVIGGKYLGIEMAIDLAQQGKKVFIITLAELGQNGKPMERTLYFTLRQMLFDNNIPVYQNAPAVEIKENGVYFLYNGDLTFLETDNVVLAVGVRPEKELVEEIRKVKPQLKVIEIGDCKEPRNALLATNEAVEVTHNF